MKGILKKKDNEWIVEYTFTPYDDYVVYKREYFLEPYDRTEKIEGKEVDFEIENFWETGMEEVLEVAVLKGNNKNNYKD